MVYVDPLFKSKKNNREGRLWCHMTADSLEELHAFAKAIGRARCWFHKGNHYDLTPSFRALAVQNGAQEVSARKLTEIALNISKS